MTKRIPALDSLRGIAALTVLAAHLFLTFPAATVPISIFAPENWQDPVTWFRYSPLRTLVGGRPAVVLFFVLSGFVLAPAFLSASRPSYPQFLWRRFCRIYLPFLCAILFAVGLASLVPVSPIEGLSDWFNQSSWTEPLSWNLVARHLLMTGLPADMSLDNVMWSLVHEIRISIAFPLIMLIIMRSTRTSIVLFSALWIAATTASFFISVQSLAGTFLDTLAYSIFFVAGSLLAKHRVEVTNWLSVWHPLHVMLGAAAAFCLFAIPPRMIGAELAFGVASIFVVTAILGRPGIWAFLEHPSLVWLGRISFSLYLFHLPILLLAFRLLHGHVPAWLIVALVVVVSLAVAEIAYRIIELPAMNLGRKHRISKALTVPS